MARTWISSLEAFGARSEPATPEVRLADYPVPLGIRQEQRTAELVREFQLITLDRRVGPERSTVPAQLLDFATAFYGQYGPALAAPRAELERAHEAGEARIELSYSLGPGSPAVMLRYARLMEEADAFCRDGQLISLAPDGEIYALRRWTVEEFVRQYHGLEPRPWSSEPVTIA